MWLDALKEADKAYEAQSPAVREQIEQSSLECEIAKIVAYFATISPGTRTWLSEKIDATLDELDQVSPVTRPSLSVVSGGRSG